jgi:hypothetical protein
MNAGWPFEEFQRATSFDLRNEWNGNEPIGRTRLGFARRGKIPLTPQGLRFADSAAELFLR